MANTMYASAIREAIASNDVQKMKAVVQQAEAAVKDQGDLTAALLELQAAIKQLEG